MPELNNEQSVTSLPTVEGSLTAEQLAEHYRANPDAYHDALKPHVEAFLQSKLGETATQPSLESVHDQEVPTKPKLTSHYIVNTMFDDKSDEVFTNEDAMTVLENPYDYQDHLLDYIHKFPDLKVDTDLANLMIEHGSGASVLQNLELFPDLVIDNALAERIILSKSGDAVLRALDLFPDLVVDEAFAHHLIDTENGEAMLSYAKELWPDMLFTPEDAHKIITSRSGSSTLLRNVDRFPGLELDGALAKDMVAQDGSHAVFENLEMFHDYDASELALAAIEKDDEYDLNLYYVTNNFHKLKGLSAEVADKIISKSNGSQAYRVIECSGAFDNLQFDGDFVLKLIHADLARLVTTYRSKFPANAFDNNLAHRVIDEIGLPKFVELSDNFKSELDVSIADSLFEAKEYDTLIRRVRCFPDFELTESRIDEMVTEIPELISKKLHLFESLSDTVLATLVANQEIPIETITNNLFRFKAIREDTLQLLHERTGDNSLTEYPRDALNHKTKDRWFGEMSYAYLAGGFNKASIGHVIRLRIENENVAENNIHDASQWLSEFEIPESGHDVPAILRDRKRIDFNPEDYVTERLRDMATEQQFITKLLNTDPALRSRLNLSGKDGTAAQLFFTPEFQLLYQAAVTHDSADQPFYKSHEFNYDSLLSRAKQLAPEFVSTTFGHSKEETTHRLNSEEMLARLDLLKTSEFEQAGPDTQISRLQQELKAMGLRRAAYAKDTQGWLARHATSPNGRLTKVWADRGEALLEGAPDNAVGIASWQQENALRVLVNSLERSNELAEKYSLTREEVLGESLAKERTELARVMSASGTIQAMSKLKNLRQDRSWQDKLLPHSSQKVEMITDGGAKLEYSFEILDKDDPKGFTIGPDTGCCMTINGASETCIIAGYELPNAGFVAMTTPEGKVGAQSFWYVHPDHPDTLVLDNIEANRGRDMTRVADVYRKALKEYLEARPELGIRKVHLGTGYTDIDMGDMPPANRVPALNSDIYSDAKKQRLLLDLNT